MIHATLRLLVLTAVGTWACREPVPGVVPPVDLEPIDTPGFVDTTGRLDTASQSAGRCDGLLPWTFTPSDTSSSVLYGVRDARYCWVGSGRGGYLYQHPAGPRSFLQVSFRTYEFDRYLTEDLVFTDIAPQLCLTQELLLHPVGNLDSVPHARMYTSSDDGDVLEDVYETNPRRRSFVRLETFDSTTQTYTGVGEVHFRLEAWRPRVNPRNPDSFSLEQIRFRFRVVD